MRISDTVAIWGCGPVGQFAIRSAPMLGVGRVIAIGAMMNKGLTIKTGQTHVQAYDDALGVAGFGTATAYAKALGLKDDRKKLSAATRDIYGGDEYVTKLAETTVDAEDE